MLSGYDRIVKGEGSRKVGRVRVQGNPGARVQLTAPVPPRALAGVARNNPGPRMFGRVKSGRGALGAISGGGLQGGQVGGGGGVGVGK